MHFVNAVLMHAVVFVSKLMFRRFMPVKGQGEGGLVCGGRRGIACVYKQLCLALLQ